MATPRVLLPLLLTTVLLGALGGTSFSDATWTGRTTTPVTVGSAYDWTPPVVTVDALPDGVSGSHVRVEAVVADSRSPIDPASVVVEHAPAGVGTWTALTGCTLSGSNPLSVECPWDTTLVPDGDHRVRVTASDTAGNEAVSASEATVVDNTAPQVALAVPAGVLSGTVVLTATATDATSGVASVGFEHAVHGSGTWTACAPVTGSWACALDTTTLTTGTSYDVRATATDTAGNTTTTPVQTRTVDNTPTTVTITDPTEGAAVDGTVTVVAQAESINGVTSVRIESRPAGGSFATLCTDTSAPYSCTWNTSPLAEGSHQLRAVMVQGSGPNLTSPTRTVTVDHTYGVLAINNPATGTTIRNQTSRTVSGTAWSVAGVTSVTLRATPVSPGGPTTSTPCTVSVPSFSCTWDTSAIVYGSYDLRVRMVQGNGVVLTSSAVAVTVDNVVASVSINGSPAPLPGGYVNGTETLTATTSSSIPVTSVRYDARPVGASTWTALCTPAATVAPYSCGWNTLATANGSYDLRAVMTLSNGATVTSTTVTVAVVNLRAVDVQGTGTGGRITNGDKLVFTYSTRIDPASLLPGFDGSETSVTVPFKNANGGLPDRIEFTGSGVPALGEVRFVQNYVTNKDFTTTATMTAALVDGATQVTISLSSVPGNRTNQDNASGALTWTPSTSVTDFFLGGACAPTTVTETGTNDRDF